MDLQQSSRVKTYTYPSGEIQKVQSVTLPDWASLKFTKPIPDTGSFTQVCDLYEKFIIPKAPYLFGTLVFFSLPDDMEMPFPFDTKYGTVHGRTEAASIALRSYMRGSKFSPDDKAKAFTDELKKRGLFRIMTGTRPFHGRVLPVSGEMGLLSSLSGDHPFISNAGFFTMDMFDLGSPYDVIGRPVGLCVKDGICLSPPLFDREALMVMKDGSISIRQPKLSDVTFEIGGKEYVSGRNARLFERPGSRKAYPKGYSAAIAGNKVIASAKDIKMIIPSAGFILKTDEFLVPGSEVVYHGFEDVLFGIQAGNSAVKDGNSVTEFTSYFSNIRDPFKLPIPPSLYPLDYEKARAPRMAIGSDQNGKPVIVWAEGPGKFDDLNLKGKFSCGASLSEMAAICKDQGLMNAVNLDGGGSAQILLDGKRKLLISDRHKEDDSEYERSVPMGLTIG